MENPTPAVTINGSKFVITQGNSSSISLTFEEAETLLHKLMKSVIQFSRQEGESVKAKASGQLRQALNLLEAKA